MNRFPTTFDNYEWLRANEDKLRNLVPEAPTLIDLTFFMRLGFGLKLMGVEWNDYDQVSDICSILTRFGVMQAEFVVVGFDNPKAGMVNRNPQRISEEGWHKIELYLIQLSQDQAFFSHESQRVAQRFLKTYQLKVPKEDAKQPPKSPT